MTRTREVGTLWIGGQLSWVEQLCLKSFVDAGQKITLFHYDTIPNVPQGVICRDGREVIDTDDFIKYDKKNSYALFADLFRLHMIHRNPGMIWIDTDVYCQRPLDYQDDYVLGYELPERNRVNNAVLGLPADSPLLQALLDFTTDRYSIAPFLPRAVRQTYAAARDAGAPVHVSQQPWGVWGPMMLSHYIRKQDLAGVVQPLAAFYPVTFRERTMFNRLAKRAESRITPATTGLHVWASNKRELGNNHLGLPPIGSWWAKAVEKHKIQPALAPITGRNTTAFDTALLAQIPRIGGTLTDIGGCATALVISLYMRDKCQIQLVDIAPDGRFGQQADAMAKTRSVLIGHGVAPEAIEVVAQPQDIRPADILLNLHGFGEKARVKHLVPVLEKGRHAHSLLYTDIRKGSGGFAFFKAYGQTEIIMDGADVRRVIVKPAH